MGPIDREVFVWLPGLSLEMTIWPPVGPIS